MNKRGFTLIEVIMVMVILTIMLAISAPSLIEWRQNAKVKEVARDILSGLRQARSMAVTENQPVTATIDLDSNELVLTWTDIDGNPQTMTKVFTDTIKIEADNDTSLESTNTKFTTFQPQGSCSAELYIRVNEDPDLLISIESTATGLARL